MLGGILHRISLDYVRLDLFDLAVVLGLQAILMFNLNISSISTKPNEVHDILPFYSYKIMHRVSLSPSDQCRCPGKPTSKSSKTDQVTFGGLSFADGLT